MGSRSHAPITTDGDGSQASHTDRGVTTQRLSETNQSPLDIRIGATLRAAATTSSERHRKCSASGVRYARQVDSALVRRSGTERRKAIVRIAIGGRAVGLVLVP